MANKFDSSDFESLTQELIAQVEKGVCGDRDIHPTTRKLMTHILLDLPLDAAVITDFGVVTDNHYRALKAVMDNTAETVESSDLAEMLDQVCGDGPGITALVEKYAPAYAKRGVVFKTAYDVSPEQIGGAGSWDRLRPPNQAELRDLKHSVRERVRCENSRSLSPEEEEKAVEARMGQLENIAVADNYVFPNGNKQERYMQVEWKEGDALVFEEYIWSENYGLMCLERRKTGGDKEMVEDSLYLLHWKDGQVEPYWLPRD